jgi:predicted MFS family arabinose efflux permease
MLDWLISFVGGAMAEYFHQRRTTPLRVFMISLPVFTILAAIILLPLPSSKSYAFIFLVVVGVGLLCAISMVIILRVCKPKSKAPKSDR